MKKLLIFCVIAVGMTGVSCKSSKSIEKLSDAKWVLKTLNGEAVKTGEQNGDAHIVFNETEKRVSGKGGCNRFFGNYEQEGNKLKFSAMGATRMACPDMELEGNFFKMLETVDNYSIKDKVLSLKTKDKVVATFDKTELTEE